MPEKTMEAVFDHGVVPTHSITNNYEEARIVLQTIGEMGISYDEVTELLEKEGVDKFIISWNDLVDSVDAALKEAK
jgi:transaldolase